MHWTGTWTTSSALVDGASLENQTLRMMMRTSIAGSTVRLRLSNAHGGAPILIASTALALRANDTAAVLESSRR